jgi:post-segregation antitoxin (ccd killing protein)
VAEVSIYLPDDLYRRALARGLPLSELLQEAVERALRRAETREWVAQMRARPRRCTAVVDTAALIDEVRSEFGT